ncbi:uncharacterized protein LOC100036989 [Xenopus laevis]|uniref:LOC100036989 protein n=1 Tax=Xenopus laevis TaxID=8355 RepID=A1L2Y5_XENLA|nr:uncharacterized protein LOC100036989 [Xenopus laevis]AAI29794.1 LOC100036989 protein [Xenopus laevis]
MSMENTDTTDKPPPYMVEPPSNSVNQGFDPSRAGVMGIPNVPAPQVHTTVVNIIPDGFLIRDHLPWSIFNTMYMNFCCLGFFAVIFSVKSRDQKVIGDRSGAMSYASTARNLNIAASFFTIITIIVVLIILPPTSWSQNRG